MSVAEGIKRMERDCSVLRNAGIVNVLGQVEDLLNDAKTQYNAAVTLINEEKTDQNTLNTWAGLANTSLTSAIALLNTVKAQHNAVDDALYAMFGVLAEVVTLVNGVKTAHNATDGEVADIKASVDGVVTLVNELKTDHNAHIALTEGGVHGAADVANGTAANDAVAPTVAAHAVATADVATTAVKAGGTVTFVLAEAAPGGGFTIPALTPVETEDGVGFVTDGQLVIAEGQLSGDIAVTAAVAGRSGNVAIGAINVIDPAIVGVESVANAGATTGGRDAATYASVRVATADAAAPGAPSAATTSTNAAAITESVDI